MIPIMIIVIILVIFLMMRKRSKIEETPPGEDEQVEYLEGAQNGFEQPLEEMIYEVGHREFDPSPEPLAPSPETTSPFQVAEQPSSPFTTGGGTPPPGTLAPEESEAGSDEYECPDCGAAIGELDTSCANCGAEFE
jgi:hypothetical protein